MRVVHAERACTPTQHASVPLDGAGRAVADPSAQEKGLQRSFEASSGVTLCFFGGFWRAKIAGSPDFLGLEREMGFEPTTLCLGSRCSTTELFPLALWCRDTASPIIVPARAESKTERDRR